MLTGSGSWEFTQGIPDGLLLLHHDWSLRWEDVKAGGDLQLSTGLTWKLLAPVLGKFKLSVHLGYVTRAPTCGRSCCLGLLKVRQLQANQTSHMAAQGSSVTIVGNKAEAPYLLSPSFGILLVSLLPCSTGWSSHKNARFKGRGHILHYLIQGKSVKEFCSHV